MFKKKVFPLDEQRVLVWDFCLGHYLALRHVSIWKILSYLPGSRCPELN